MFLDARRHWSADSAHLGIEVKFPRNLGPGRTIDDDRDDGEVSSLERLFRRRFDCDHGG